MWEEVFGYNGFEEQFVFKGGMRVYIKCDIKCDLVLENGDSD